MTTNRHDESLTKPLNDSVSTSQDSLSPLSSPRGATLSSLLRNKRLLAETLKKNRHFNASDHDSRIPFQQQEQMEHRHKIRPVQLFVPSNSNPNALRLNKAALNAVLNRTAIANRKVVKE
jgi:hypothetical protein